MVPEGKQMNQEAEADVCDSDTPCAKAKLQDTDTL